MIKGSKKSINIEKNPIYIIKVDQIWSFLIDFDLIWYKSTFSV